jgi:tetratricopeptide (TPR) repeat protein
MRSPSVPAARRRWTATIIITVFLCAVIGAAAAGWWYARESPPHQGPLVVIAVDRMAAAALSVYGGQRTDTPAIDAFAADAVVFERAYTHSPQLLPAGASLLSGELPFDHGVRDDAGFALSDDVRTMAELLRNRGFATGAAVSSFLLRRESGIAQGFSFFDAELPAADASGSPALERDGAMTVTAAEQWLKSQSGQRFFLFVQVDDEDADAALARLSELLEERGLYDDATIVLVGNRGDIGSGMSLDEAALRVPLLVKQPASAGAGRRIAAPVQHIDLLPTLLDLVRAPRPGSLRGRSLRPVLDGDDSVVPAQPIYAETLTAWFRFGGHAMVALADDAFRLVRGVDESLVAIAPPVEGEQVSASTETGRLRAALDQLIGQSVVSAPMTVPPMDEERLAMFGYLASVRLAPPAAVDLPADAQRAVVDAHRAAALLVGQKKYSAGIRALQAIVREHPTLTAVHYQVGVLLSRTGRYDEAIAALREARMQRPESVALALALTEAQMRANMLDDARATADEAIALAEGESAAAADRAAAHEIAARVALARKDSESALAHAEAAATADPALPVLQFVRGRLALDAEMFDDAIAAFRQADASLREAGRTMPDLHLFLGEALSRNEQYTEAETQLREELVNFPRNTQAYASLAMLYRASNKDDAVEDVLNELVAATPTPEGYAVAARLWTVLGDRTRAEALRTDARARFRGDPSIALLGRDERR